MALKRKVRQIGNSLALPIPGEVFEFLGFNYKDIKYKLIKEITGEVYILILKKDVIALEEKKFQKLGNTPAIIIPKPLCIMWNIGLEEGKNRELLIEFDDSPLKWKLYCN